MAEIQCDSTADSTGTRSSNIVWYSADIGAMVKSLHRVIGPSGKEVTSDADELRSYEPAPAPKPKSEPGPK